MVHPVQRGSLSSCGCQILHNIDTCDYMCCATRWLQHSAATLKRVKGDEMIFPQRGVSPEELRVENCGKHLIKKKEAVFWFGCIKTHSTVNHK